MPRQVARPRPLLLAVALVVPLAPGPLRAAGTEVSWRNVGPGGGGWIQSIAFDPHRPETIHLGCDVGGYYRSDDGGRTFQIRNAGLRDNFIEDIAVDPRDPHTIYLATPSGVHKSVDDGATWHLKRGGFPEPRKSAYSAPIGRVVIDPRNPLTLYAGEGRPRSNTYGRGRIYRSIDGGESWHPLDGIAAVAPEAVIHRIAIHPETTRVLFAATDRGLFKSEDGGETWGIRERGLPHPDCRNVVVHPARPRIVYAVLWSAPGVNPWRGGVYRSDDGGDSWTERNGGLPAKVAPPGDAPEKTCNYIRFLVDPRDPERIFVGANSWWNAGLYRSGDGGRSWDFLTQLRDNPRIDPGWLLSWGPTVKCIALSPLRPDSILFGTSGIILRSDDGGDTWRQRYCEPLPDGRWRGNGLEVTCLDEIALDPFDRRRVLCGYADIGLMLSEDAGLSWSRAGSGLPQQGDIARVVFDPARRGVAWCCEGKTSSRKGCVATSADGGRTWTVTGSTATGLPGAATRFLALDPSSPATARTLYVHSHGHGVFKSTDGGASWKPASAGLGERAVLGALAPDPADPRRLCAAINRAPDGGLFETRDGGASWHRIHAPTLFLDVYDISLDARRPDAMAVACRERYDHATRKLFAGGVFLSADRGRTWRRALDDRFATCVRPSPHDPDTLCAGTTDHPYFDFATGRGIFLSDDGGVTWRAINDGLTVSQIGTVTFDPTNPRRLYAGTSGNGLFVGELSPRR